MIKILIVEDVSITALDISEQLKDYGYHVEEVITSGEEAIKAIERTHYDIVLMDITLSGKMRGTEAAKIIWEEHHIPIIFITADADKKVFEEAKQSAPYGYLVKPFEPRDLKIAIEIAISKFLMEKQLRASEARFHSAFDHSSIGMALISFEGHFIQVNPAFERIIGYTEAELAKLSLKEITFPSDFQKEEYFYQRLRKGETNSFTFEKRFIHKNREHVWVRETVSVVMNGTSYYIFQFEDITVQKKMEEELFQIEHFDRLTGLANRTMLEGYLNDRIREGGDFAVLYVNIDRFRLINDLLGREEGDALLQEVASRLRTFLRAKDVIARLEGDTFVLILANCKEVETAILLARRIHKSFIEKFAVKERATVLTVSIGIALYPIDAKEGHELVQKAETAMHVVKEKGGNDFLVHTGEISSIIKQRALLERNLRHAIEFNEFELYYQPKVKANNKKITGFEALIRWPRPDGMVSPGEFIPLSEEMNLITPLDEWVLNAALRQQRAWKANGYNSFPVAINLSPIHLLHEYQKLDQVFAQAADKYELPLEMLEVEVTESALIVDTEHCLSVLQKLREQGIKVAIDDFGTRYALFNYLKQFTIDIIKIDRSFVQDIEKKNNKAIVQAMIVMSQALGIKTVAEGVETKEQFDILASCGVDEIQGYFISKPLPADKIPALL